jgi:hypothetical protein
MKWIFSLILVSSFIQIDEAKAFDRRRCGKVYGSTSGFGKNETFWAKFFSASTSTSQFLTSTGDCRLIGGVSTEDKKYFIADNADQLMNDIVRAEGDYLEAVAFLYECEKKSFDQLARSLQKNVTTLFGKNLDYSPAKVSDELDSFIGSDLDLQKICSGNEA